MLRPGTPISPPPEDDVFGPGWDPLAEIDEEEVPDPSSEIQVTTLSRLTLREMILGLPDHLAMFGVGELTAMISRLESRLEQATGANEEIPPAENPPPLTEEDQPRSFGSWASLSSSLGEPESPDDLRCAINKLRAALSIAQEAALEARASLPERPGSSMAAHREGGLDLDPAVKPDTLSSPR